MSQANHQTPGKQVGIVGEVLFDHFPDGSSVLGGAPFNVAWHLQAFGLEPLFISRIGEDRQGEQISASMQAWGMRLDALQTDPDLPTGRVSVTFDTGEPSYDIVKPSAWDRIEASRLPDCQFDWLYHGSLAARSDASQASIERLVRQQSESTFIDVNLRPPFWQRESVLAMLGRANWAKLNSDELEQLQTPQPAADATRPSDPGHAFLEQHALDGLILTRGADGAELLSPDRSTQRIAPESNLKLIDTVGTGDAFASVMLTGLVLGWEPPQTLQRAQGFASAIVGQRGATVSDPAFYDRFRADWKL